MSTWDFVTNVVVAMVCGLTLGLERQWRQHPVGLRTNALICIGAALFVSVSALLADKDQGPTRITSQVVTGIGFLGGGAILREGFNIKGLTTAATIWCSAAVGALCGFGYLVHAGIGTGIILFVNFGLHPVSEWLERAAEKSHRDPHFRYRLSVSCTLKRLAPVRVMVLQHLKANSKIVLHSVEKEVRGEPQHAVLVAECESTEPADTALEELVALIQLEEGVGGVRWERVWVDRRVKHVS